MRETIFLALIIFLALLILVGCETKKDTENSAENVIENVVTEKKETIDIKEEIEAASKRYFDMLYGDKIAKVKISNIKVYEGKQREDTLVIVDLGENDYAFELDFEIKPTSKEYVEELCEYVGSYDEETGLVSQKQAYGVMRYNVLSNEYDVTAITEDGF